MKYSNITLYIKAEQIVEVRKPEVSLGHLFMVECTEQNIVNRLNSIQIIKFTKNQYRRTVISILKIIEEIHKLYPDIGVVNLGATDIIVAYENQKTPSNMFHILKAVVVSIVAFVGSAYSIMAFSNDVDTLDIFDMIYELIVGTPSNGYTVLEASYSIGLIVGIIIFFNHFGKKKMTADPTPMEIEMRLYEQDIQTTLIQNYARKGDTLDVGSTNYINDHRNQ